MERFGQRRREHRRLDQSDQRPAAAAARQDVVPVVRWVLVVAGHGAVRAHEEMLGVVGGFEVRPLRPQATVEREGSWIARSWLTGPRGRVLDKLAVQHVSFELSSRTAGAGDRWLSLHHDIFWVAYQPPSHFWMLQGAEGVVVLAVATLCVLATARMLERRAAA